MNNTTTLDLPVTRFLPGIEMPVWKTKARRPHGRGERECCVVKEYSVANARRAEWEERRRLRWEHYNGEA